MKRELHLSDSMEDSSPRAQFDEDGTEIDNYYQYKGRTKFSDEESSSFSKSSCCESEHVREDDISDSDS